MAAGMAGGLAGTVAMTLAHVGISKLTGRQSRGGPQDATVLTAERLLGRQFAPDEKEKAGMVVHFAFGMLAGAGYGAAVAVARPVCTGAGLPLGMGLFAGAHMVALPALGLSESPLDRPLAGELVEFAAHLVYGVVTEGIRRAIVSTVS
jgi:uncharacterized membrane protein YagU involved in acid resistance